jgi:Universal stress protein family
MSERVYLIIMDETDEARLAFRFAARRAAKTGGRVHILALIPPQDFVPFGGVQATIEQEARDRAEVLVTSVAGSMVSAGGKMPVIAVERGEGVEVTRDYLAAHPEVSALVLGAAARGSPGPLVSHFASHHPGQLPCLLMIVPGGLSEEALERLT